MRTSARLAPQKRMKPEGARLGLSPLSFLPYGHTRRRECENKVAFGIC